MASIAANPFCEYEPAALDHGSLDMGRAGDSFQWVILSRQGLRPLHICGRILLHASNRCVGLPTWSEVTLYETRAGRLASSLTHNLTESLGRVWQDATLQNNALALQRAVFSHDPMIAVSFSHEDFATSGDGFHHATEQVALAGLFRGAWFGMVRALFGSENR